MRKISFFMMLAMTGFLTVSAQKKTNGNIYIEHPAIAMVQELEKAFLAGDSAKMSSLLADNFKGYNGTSNHMNGDMVNKAAFISNSLRYKAEFDYLSLTDFPGSYPDALEYAKDNKDNEVTVLVWALLKGVHKKTGVKIDAAAHYAFTLNNANKITSMIDYSNDKVFDEIKAGLATRTYGIIYNHHENINTVRKSMYAFEKGDVDKALSFFTDSAKFYDINNPIERTSNMTETKADWQKFLSDFEIVNIEETGYPDYFQYEINNSRVVSSWWKFNLVRKLDKKKLTVPYHLEDSFDADGKITFEISYYGAEMLKN